MVSLNRAKEVTRLLYRRHNIGLRKVEPEAIITGVALGSPLVVVSGCLLPGQSTIHVSGIVSTGAGMFSPQPLQKIVKSQNRP